jgi:hypothetical protein
VRIGPFYERTRLIHNAIARSARFCFTR